AADANGVDGVDVSSMNYPYSIVIGGPTPQDGNTISGNANAGIEVDDSSSKVTIQNNLVGVDPTGTSAVPNIMGVEIAGESDGGITIDKNVISGNSEAGVDIHDTSDFVSPLVPFVAAQ
ncbi:MAG: right-handed parallel beta-helix repeat-containing protein, partial [Mycobacterium sp.]